MADSIRSFNIDPPTKAALVDRERDITGQWQDWTDRVSRRLSVVTVATFDVDPPSVAAGGFQQVTANVPGVRAGQFVQASFTPGNASVLVHGESVTNGQIVATFHNISGGAIDLPAGTLRLRIDGD